MEYDIQKVMMNGKTVEDVCN